MGHVRVPRFDFNISSARGRVAKPLRETARGAEARTDVQSSAPLPSSPLSLSLSLSLSRRRNAYRNCVTMATVMSECGYDAVVRVARR